MDQGKELPVTKSSKQARIAANHAKHLAKMERNKAKYEAGMNRARKGIFKKGRK